MFGVAISMYEVGRGSKLAGLVGQTQMAGGLNRDSRRPRGLPATGGLTRGGADIVPMSKGVHAK